MSCSACSSRVEKVVGKLDGIKTVSVNLLTGTMQVEFDEAVTDVEKIIKAVEGSGYGAYQDDVRGGHVVQSGGSQGGYEGQAGGNCSDGACSISISRAGDAAAGNLGGAGRREASASQGAIDETAQMKKRLIWSIILLLPLMTVSMGPMLLGNHRNTENPLTMIMIQVIFLIPIVFLNRKFFVKGLPALFKGGANMDSLIAVGAGAAIVYGVFALFRIAHGYETGDMALVHKYSADIYFESAAMILTLITVGKYLEARSKGKTSQAIEKLVNLAPKTATVERDGKEIEVETWQLSPGDILVIRPGESIAADGEIISGTTAVDEAAITGESIPVEKKTGDKVISATINKTGFIKVRCERVGEDTTISQIVRLVEEASASKAPIARLADRIAGVFVPAVMGIALVTAVVWLVLGYGFEHALSMGISVLVISCPCALGLATPVAIMVGTGKGAENGILIKSGEAFETACHVDTVVMDKTGTITEGKPVVTDVITEAEGVTEEELLAKAASIEAGSEHPLAEAVLSEAEKRGISFEAAENFQALFGKGAKAEIGGVSHFAGNESLMQDEGIDTSAIEEKLKSLGDGGKTPLIFAAEGKILGIIAVSDVEKPTSRAAIEEFKKMGIDVVMLTGDNPRTAEAIRRRMNIPEVIAGVLPADKEKHVARLQAEGRKVAMIGDGINDAPALTRADVGIAIGAGTDVAIESADAVLMRSDLLDAVTAVKLSKAVIRNIKENLFWAFFYNVIGIPVAAGLLFIPFGIKLSPMIGAAAMSLSSVCVVTNALRLRRFKADRKPGGIRKETYNMEENFEEEKTMKYEFKVEGMMCMHCQKHVNDALAAMDGVKEVDVDLEGKKATVEADREISMDEFKKVISEAGYQVVE